MTRKIMCSQTGFSLLEMMLVVLILSTLAFSAIDIVDNKDNQVRFEDTRRRLELIRRAVIGEQGAVYNGQRLLSGYVADNGLLPLNIQGLIRIPTDYDAFALKSPIFDADPDASGINDDPAPLPPALVLSGPGEQLFKGYRSGSYLTPPPSGTPPLPFYDGWGDGAPSDFGWTVTGGPTAFITTSPGANRVINAADSDYDTDIGITVTAEDWQVDANGWAVTVSNQSATDLAVALPGCVRASLIAYVNDADQVNPFNWKRLTSACIVGNGVLGVSDGSCLDGTDVDTDVAGSPCATSAQVIFSAGGFQPPTLTPGGEHLLVLVVDDDATPHNGSAGELPCTGSGNCGTTGVPPHTTSL